MPCTTTNGACQKDEICETSGQDKGFCVPKAAPATNKPNQSQSLGSFALSTKRLELTNQQTFGLLELWNKSKVPVEFKITRLQDDTPTGQSPKTALNWLQFAICADSQDTSCKSYTKGPDKAEPFPVGSVPPNKRVLLKVLNAGSQPSGSPSYQGSFAIEAAKLGQQVVYLSYTQKADGQWSGRIYAFGNFNDTVLPKPTDKVSSSERSQIPNAFIRRWQEFKTSAYRDSDIEAFRASMQSIQNQTWKVDKALTDCAILRNTQKGKVACYPYKGNQSGYGILSESLQEAPVPTGVTELSITMNLEEVGNALKGRIVSDQTLQYPGDPAIQMAFQSTPSSGAFSQITQLVDTNIYVGGRYNLLSQDNPKDAKNPIVTGSCDTNTFAKLPVPWLIPGFSFGTHTGQGLLRERYECRNFKYPNTARGTLKKEDAQALNRSLSESNPIPNGRSIIRRIELVDGALIRNKYLFIIYKERFRSFFDPTKGALNGSLNQDFVSYGYMWLERVPANLYGNEGKGCKSNNDCNGDQRCFKGFCQDNPYQGSTPPSLTKCATSSACSSGEECVSGTCRIKSKLKQVSCDAATIQEATGSSLTLSSMNKSQREDLVRALLYGQPKSSGYTLYETSQQIKQHIHYFCGKTGQFDGGKNQDTCPVGSNVIFFELDDANGSKTSQHSCNDSGTCDAILQKYRTTVAGFRENVPWRCKDNNTVFCDSDRTDLRSGKEFYKKSSSSTSYVSPYNPLRADIGRAFRYKIQFRNRSGGSLGFTPSICQKGSNAIPYCYSPDVIEQIERRVNCLEAIYTDKTIYDSLGPGSTLSNALKDELKFIFSYNNERNSNGDIITNLGFESLNAELKIMLGDEALVKASASRFDLAGSNLYSFRGDLLEPNGVKLSGALGFEMHNLYLAVQYYQMVLDRAFAQSSVIQASFRTGNPLNYFITLETVTSYFKKLITASTNKARVMSTIAQRYHRIAREDIAKFVVQRAYIATFIEFTVLTRLMRELVRAKGSKSAVSAQIRDEIDKASLTYKAELIRMNEVFRKVSKQLNFFGFPDNYIPFPALENNQTNAFKVAFDFAKQKMLSAKEKENLALQSKRSFDTDAVSFQNELVKIEQNYENQLVELCGTITSNGSVYPAIPKYAYLDSRAEAVGNPCGLMGSGQLYVARAQLDKVRISFQSLRVSQANVKRQIDAEAKRIQAYCNKKWELSQFTWTIRGEQNNLQKQIRSAQETIDSANRIYEFISKQAQASKCFIIAGTANGTDCPLAALSATTINLAHLARDVVVKVQRNKINNKQTEIEDLNRQIEAQQYKLECDNDGTAKTESANRIRNLRNSMLNFELEALKADYDIRIAISNIVQLQNKAQRLIAQMEESSQLAINVQAAKNDPNVRIYKNDAILTAESTFEIALREAYRSTLVYEYYTGQSYKRKGELYLIRMVSYGKYTLESYLTQLELDFREFEENNGKPDTRVAVFSLRDDILKIARVAEDGTPRSISERIDDFQAAITDRNRLNAEGFLSFPFDISVDKGTSKVSPITINHKLLYIEAEIIGGDIGDSTGRLYLRQKGTSWVRLGGNNFQYYVLPPRIAVINPFFNGVKTFNPVVYQNYRLRERPLANSHWELLLNQFSERVNQDINLNSLNDIRLYVYYTDFTEQ